MRTYAHLRTCDPSAETWFLGRTDAREEERSLLFFHASVAPVPSRGFGLPAAYDARTQERERTDAQTDRDLKRDSSGHAPFFLARTAGWGYGDMERTHAHTYRTQLQFLCLLPGRVGA